MVPTSKQKDNITFEDVLEKVKACIEDEEKIKGNPTGLPFAQKNMKDNLEKVGNLILPIHLMWHKF